MRTYAWKCLTHDLRPPIQGGEPLITGPLPVTLPVVEVDVSDTQCAKGWNACLLPQDALRITGLWPNGRPSRLFSCSTETDVVTVGDKTRAATWTIERECPEDEIRTYIIEMCRPWFSDLTEEMVDQQMSWRAALSRPFHKHETVVSGLKEALEVRELNWELKEFPAAWAARDARAARDAWAAWAAWAAWDARDARAARDAWAAWAAWAAWDARDARAALQHYYACRRGWIAADPLQYTIGIRDAYTNGLAIAIPTGTNELGWAMESP
jgi:hypothetical protein